MNDFIYEIPTKIYFGDQLAHLHEEIKVYGKRVLLCYGGGSIKKSGLYDKVVAEVKKAGALLYELSGIEPNPRITSVRKGAQLCKDEKVDLVLAVGGGSVIDCAKFVAAGAYYAGDAWDIVLHKTTVEKCLPIISVLTLSATGSEMDNCGVISNLETNEKIGAGYDPMRPKVSFLDPANTYTVSAYQTACGAADILSHIIEVYFSKSPALYMIDGFMETLMRTVVKYAPIAMKDPENYEARANLMWTSSWAINGFIACGNDTAWSCHTMEHILSAFYDITHGLGLAILTPRWMKHCLNEKTLPRFVQFGVNVMGIDSSLPPQTIAEQAIEKFADFLYGTLGLKSTLTAVGIDKTNLKKMADEAIAHGNFQNTFVPLTAQDILKIYEACL